MNTARPFRLAWFNCFSGIAGDMALGSLVDAGADVPELVRILERLPIGGWTLDFEPVMRNGLACTRALVSARGDSVVRTWMHILGVLEEARLPDLVRDRAIAAFSVLAQAEGRIHRRPAAQVHFHEVGGHDTIVDIVGSAAALSLLEVGVVASSAVALGSGVIRTSHGLYPNPAPAVVDLLRGIPTAGRDVHVELTTPTGAAMVKAWAESFGPVPAMTVEATGYGAGSQEIEGMPNCTQVVLGSPVASTSPPHRPLVVLETNIDDASGETLAHAVEVLIGEGALDAWITPIVMKKGRPAHLVSVLTDSALAARLGEVLATETGSLGVRSHTVERSAVTRSETSVDVDGFPVRVKVSPGRVKAEHDDVARAARALGRPLREVAASAEGSVTEEEERSVLSPLPEPPEGEPA